MVDDLLMRSIALMAIILLSPLLLILSLAILICSGWPIVFKQKRVGLKGEAFEIYKFRTMINGAEDQKDSYQKLNEVDGPVFKINNDPRFTKIGGFLCHSGLDELLQLFNVVKGEMSIVGPRPFPMGEESKIENKYKVREMVKPGIISPWVLNGYHKMGFSKWMESDVEYVKNKTFSGDLVILIGGIVMLMKLVGREIFSVFWHK